LKDLKLLRIDPPRKDILESERNIANLQKMADIFGAQEMTERIALYQLNDKTYLGGFILLRYGESWKIYSLCSNLAGTSVMGGVEQISIMDYALLL
jgi:hypothetical protein